MLMLIVNRLRQEMWLAVNKHFIWEVTHKRHYIGRKQIDMFVKYQYFEVNCAFRNPEKAKSLNELQADLM
jgi:predicted kinase